MDKLSTSNGTIIASNEGMIRLGMTPAVVMLPFTQSMMVVTSPIGENAPPALAAMTIRQANLHLSVLSATILRSNMTMTMVVVRLSNTADMKYVMKESIHRSSFFFLVVILSVMMENPLCASMSSTIVIAPIRKNSVDATSPNPSMI